MQLPHVFSEPMSSHYETGLVSRRLRGLLASCPSLPSRSRAGGPATASAYSHLGLVLADSSERHGFCSLSICGNREAQARRPVWWAGRSKGAFLAERDTHGHTTPSHNIRHHRGPVPLAVGEGMPPLEHKGPQMEAHQEYSVHSPWAFGCGA